MAGFCRNCGSPVGNDEKFCGKCGTATGNAAQTNAPASAARVSQPSTSPAAEATPAASSQAAAAAAPRPAAAGAAASVAPKKGMSTMVKVLLAFGAFVFVGGVLAIAGVIYMAHRVKEKVHELTANEVHKHGGQGEESGGDACRFLSKAEVGQAIGADIVATEAGDDSCSYLAMGDQAEMSAKHSTALLKAQGADPQAQKQLGQFSESMFKSFEQEMPGGGKTTSGQVPVLTVSVKDGSRMEMQLNSRVLGQFRTGPEENLNIGDEAFTVAQSIMMVRKGDKIIRILYMTCPCADAEIKPLAERIVAQL